MMRTICMAAMCMLLSSCGETAYKMGGSGDEFRAVQESCRAESSDKATYKACVKAKGWTTVGIDDDDSEPAAPEQKAASATAPTPAASATVLVPGDAPTATAPSHPVNPSPEKTASADPYAMVTVGSWWKMGPTDFKADLHACIDQLGSGQHYDETKHTATRGLVTCMRGKGWRAY